MKKIMILFVAALFAGKGAAQETQHIVNDWNDNWFLTAEGGVSVFVGKPLGHGDLFDREKPMLSMAVGKWFTPSVGGRLTFQGLQLIDAEMQTRDFQSVHADFLYNLTASKNGEQKWDIIPYAGCGIIRNSYTHQKPFAISYGIIGRYRLNDYLHLTGELGGTTTWQDFDGQGASNKLGDHLLQASIGISVTFGKKHDTTKRMSYNIECTHWDNDENGKAAYSKASNNIPETYPRNNYSGLNKLRERLKNRNWDGDENHMNSKTLANDDSLSVPTDSTNIAYTRYIQKLKKGKTFVGAPIYFFFKIGTHELTEKAQAINITEVAKIIKKHGLHARIIGAADSQTGTADGNKRLSAERATYIAGLLEEQGVDAHMIETKHRGGIDNYEPLAGNRNTCVVLYLK